MICDVWKTEDMPIDQEGNRAHAIMDGDSTIKRMNIGRLYEQYLNATSRTITNQVRQVIAANQTEESYQQAADYLLNYYRIVSPRMHELITSPKYTKSMKQHVDDVIKDGIYLWLPTDNPVYTPDMIQTLRQEYPIHFGPVTYRGRSGRQVETVSNVLIGSVYVMLLEKTSTYDWSGVSSAKLQHFGIPARLTRFDKHSTPGRPQPVRISGESEVRLFSATIGGDATADLLDMSNNPITHKEVVANILRAPRPTDIELVVDRQKTPLGNSRALAYVNHALQCAGVEFFYTDNDDVPLPIYTREEDFNQ